MLPKHWQLMGVINITPNSFSDGGHWQTSEQVLKQMQKLLQQSVTWLDIGAESTAPMNAAVTSETEIERFQTQLYPILPALMQWSQKQGYKLRFSIDTYRARTFRAVYQYLIQSDPECSVIWNDVSGQLDQDLLTTLADCPRAEVVLSHNLVSTRAETGQHMQFVNQLGPEHLFAHLHDFFDQRHQWLKQHKLQARALFDPCFGFAKSLEQNLYLLGQLPKLVAQFPDYPWLIGISRKSMLKYLAAPDERLSAREFWHGLILSEWQRSLPASTPIIIRLHDPDVVKMLALNGVNYATLSPFR